MLHLNGKYKFSEVIGIQKASHCAVCETYTYTLPCLIEPKFESYLAPMGKCKYPLTHSQIVKVENEVMTLSGNINRAWFDVKFSKEPDKYKRLFNMMIAAYVADVKNIQVDLDI